ncbi:hypothetical protein VSS37_03895 [Candidatus Thiothrix sp. Deng01]|uniref:Uncharacterized protein n=1 Tax=Candidatus Thiothrix phosphatis TaxID=3112415 RepID=A0ABU6CTM7_9GAMM|nr:hypothetical protein [Candidatus Thiothrix sp. Deng01]MEB4590114.1 hypothetical protein [Candidatus Thiothrix sp. Deng01]
MAVMAIDNFQWNTQANEVSSYFTVIRDLVARAHEEVTRRQAISKSCQTLDTAHEIICIARAKAEEHADIMMATPFPVELEYITHLAESILTQEFKEILQILETREPPWFSRHKHKQFIQKVISNRDALLDLIQYLKQFHRADAWDLQFCNDAHHSQLGDRLNQNSETFSANDWITFVDALESPQAPSERLQAAAKNHRRHLSA